MRLKASSRRLLWITLCTSEGEMSPEEDIWQRALSYIRQEDAHLFNSWLTDTHAFRLDGDLIWVQVPTEFLAQYLTDQYLPLIKAALARAAGRQLEVKFLSRRPPEPPKRGYLRTDEPSLYEKYTFENFVVGSGNRFAHAASRAVAEAPGRAYNPLVIYGAAGLGKTHLIQAIGNYVRRTRPDLSVLFTPTEGIMNDMILAIQTRNMIAFKRKFRDKDLLLIDDIHFLANKEGLQEEIFHTFNTLYDARKQIVMTSDRAPKDIPTLEERLVSRFQWGLVVDLRPPDLETRIAILQKKCELDGMVLPEDVIYYIASEVKSNIRTLEGCLIRLLAWCSCNKIDPTLEVATNVLKEIITPTARITVARIIAVVADYFNLSEEAITGRRRSASIVLPRQVAMYLSREIISETWKAIASSFGRDHSTVIHAHEKVANLLSSDPSVKTAIDEISRILSG